MSHFQKAVPILAALTRKPLFIKMLQTQEAAPMMVGIDKDILRDAQEKHHKIIIKSLNMLSYSTRYLEKIQRGTPRFNLENCPQGEVSPWESWVATRRRNRIKSLVKKAKAKINNGPPKRTVAR